MSYLILKLINIFYLKKQITGTIVKIKKDEKFESESLQRITKNYSDSGTKWNSTFYYLFLLTNNLGEKLLQQKILLTDKYVSKQVICSKYWSPKKNIAYSH